MPNIALVKFQQISKPFRYQIKDGLNIKPGDHCIIEIERGIEYAKIKKIIQTPPDSKEHLALKKILRIATPRDKEQLKKNKLLGEKAKSICQRKIKDKNLEMKLIWANYTFDAKKVIFYFISERRIDFRNLVKELASEFKTRIEMRQIGVRDEAKLLGGVGPCGKILCCSSYLTEFVPVSIRMVKDQNLTLNPNKISGMCGRLMCCISYEYPIYEKYKSLLPKIGEKVIAINRDEEAKVVGLDILKELVYLEFEGGARLKVPSSQIKRQKQQKEKKGKYLKKRHK